MRKNGFLEGLPRPLGVIFVQIRYLLIVSLFARESSRFVCDYAAAQLFVNVFSLASLPSDAKGGGGGVDCVFLFSFCFFCFFFRIKNVFF